MTAKKWADEELLTVLACDIDARPAAPGVDELAPFVRAARRSPGELCLEIDPAGQQVLEAFVAAEQVCCSGIGWALEHGNVTTLRITAGDAAIEALTALVPTNIHIEEVQ